MRSYDVRIHAISLRQRKLPYEVRWRVGNRPFSKSFATKALADSFRAELLAAARAGEPFDVETGMPERVALRPAGPSWLEHAVAYTDMKWRRVSPNSRTSIADALATVTPALMRPRRGRPEPKILRAALYSWAFVPPHRDRLMPPDISDALDWAHAASLPLAALDDADTTRRALDAIATKMDGRPAAATTVRRKRAVYNALGYAVERRFLPANPVDKVQWTAPEIAEAIDRSVVANPGQVRALLRAVGRERGGSCLVAFFGCLYFGGTRPSEAADLRADDARLPAAGWGELALSGTSPYAGSLWTDSGDPRERRELKRRARKTVRPVPIPPEFVQMLRAHREKFGTASDGRFFQAARGGHVSEGEYGRIWRAARLAALTPAQAASPLAARPYDLRHAAATLWLNSGVEATEVARRLGHSVAVLLKIYANCLDGQERQANARIEDALNATDNDKNNDKE